MDQSTDPALRSWVPVTPDSHFPIQNLPYGVFCRSDNDPPEIGVAIGDKVLSVCDLAKLGFFDDVIAFGGRFWFAQQQNLNGFMKCGKELWRPIRERISQLLEYDNHRIRDKADLRKQCLLPQASVRMLLPVQIHNYTDFYSSREHATNVGIMMRGPQNALQPNWLHLPVAYHGRASSIVVSGTDLHRPHGQTKADDAPAPSFGPSRNVDFELEMGIFVGPGNELGKPITVGDAREHIFGMVLVNDWSARDIQKWEYVPLGPFLAKNFGTSISPWVVTLDALEPFRCQGPAQDPQPLPYLRSNGPQAYDIQLEVQLQSSKMDRPHRICASNAKHLYWNIAQQLAHHTVNGCNMQSGDLLASGTISGPTPDSFGSMLELAWKGTKPLQLPNGEKRSFLEDGDRVTMSAWCQGPGYRVGFGEVTAKNSSCVNVGSNTLFCAFASLREVFGPKSLGQRREGAKQEKATYACVEEAMTEKTISPRNRRQDIRRTTKCWTKATCRKGTLDLGGDLAMRVLDLGETGVRLVVGQPIAIHQEVAVTLDAPNNLRPMRVVGQVMWCLETAEHQFCIGIQFGKRITFREVMRMT